MTKAEWKARALIAEANVMTLKAQIADLTAERDLAEAGRAELEQSLEAANDEIVALGRERGDLKAKAADLNLSLDAARAFIAELKRQLDAAPTPPPPPAPPKTDRWFADSSPWNQDVRSKPVHPNSQAIVNQILDGLPGVNDQQGQPSRPTANVISFSAGACWNQWDYEHPVFFAKDTDPLKTIQGNSTSTGTKIRVPANAWVSQHPPPSGGGDSACAIVQPDGQGYDFWQTTLSATEIRASWSEKTCNYKTGTGLPGITLGDFALGAGVLRPSEIVAGVIPHALFLVTYNYSGWQAPAGTGRQPGRFLSHPSVPKMGTRLRLDLTDTEINALPAYLRPLARACQTYGLIVGDTGGGGLHCDNSDKAAWVAAGKAAGAPEWQGTYTFDLRPHVDMRSKLKVLA